ncbi:hypothetical protein [Cysteiniphilum halobium]|uniref:hypothetical protein n=1 Tax=Cysteiniphilum halobium TaxID=2219059 RepID=UPI003F860FE5
MSDKVAVNYQIGATTLEVNHQRVLKGTFTFASAFTQKFVELYDQHQYVLDELVNAYIWSCQHVKDAEGEVFNIIQQFKITPTFDYFSLDGFIIGGHLHVGKLLFGALMIPYYAQYAELEKAADVTKLLDALERANKEFSGLYQQVIAYAITHVKTLAKESSNSLTQTSSQANKVKPVSVVMPHNNLFDCVFSTVKLGHSETINSGGLTLRKASIARFFDAVGKSEATGDLNEEMISLIDQAVPTMAAKTFAFFEFFADPGEWLRELNPAKIYTFAQYLNLIKDDSNKADYYAKASMQLQQALTKIPLKIAKQIVL